MADKYKIKVLQRLDADNFIVETTPYTDPIVPPDPPSPPPPDDHNHDHSSHMVTVTPDYVLNLLHQQYLLRRCHRQRYL